MTGFTIIGDIADRQTIAAGTSVRDRRRLQRQYGRGRWRKMKGIARVRLDTGGSYLVEVHWYEAGNVGKKELKIKRYL